MKNVILVAFLFITFHSSANGRVNCDTTEFEQNHCDKVKVLFSSRTGAKVLNFSPNHNKALILEASQYLWLLDMSSGGAKLIGTITKEHTTMWASSDKFVVDGGKKKYAVTLNNRRLKRVMVPKSYLAKN